MYKVSKPPIWREGNRMLLEIEQVVRCFPRYHKYATGGELRRQAMVLCQRVSRALSATGDARLLRVRKLPSSLCAGEAPIPNWNQGHDNKRRPEKARTGQSDD